MVLSNAERQARHRQRLKDRANGLTAERMREAMRIYWEALADPDLPSWNEYLAQCRSEKRGADNWRVNLPNLLPADDFEEYGEHSELLRNARLLLDSILKP